jgi:hypothetical protein
LRHQLCCNGDLNFHHKHRTIGENASYGCRNGSRQSNMRLENRTSRQLLGGAGRVTMRITSKPLQSTRDPIRVGATVAVSDEIEAMIRRFDVSARRTVRRLLYSSPRFVDLANVFPGALYAIATRRGPAGKRRRATELIEEGAQLKEVARVLDLPSWLRRLPPEAFRRPIPDLPASEMFARRVVNQLPANPTEAALWLESSAFGTEACNEYFALWLAGQPVFNDAGDARRLFGMLAAYAWFSGADGTRAHNLIVVSWRPEMAFDTAVCAAKSWLNRMRLVLQLRPGAILDSWLQPGEANGLTFVPLVEQSEILAESHAMQNCADQYADRLARDKCRLFSVRRKGTRVATLEIGPHPRETGVLAISQLKARHNMPASAEIWQAAHAWLSGQKDIRRQPPLVVPERTLDIEAWESLMQPYRLAKRGAPWVPEAASLATFAELDGAMADLARRGGVSSWLFT